MAIDTFLIQNPYLRKLKLINVGMTNEHFKVFSVTVAQSRTLISLDISQN
jgi:hypothetical protein